MNSMSIEVQELVNNAMKHVHIAMDPTPIIVFPVVLVMFISNKSIYAPKTALNHSIYLKTNVKLVIMDVQSKYFIFLI